MTEKEGDDELMAGLDTGEAASSDGGGGAVPFEEKVRVTGLTVGGGDEVELKNVVGRSSSTVLSASV